MVLHFNDLSNKKDQILIQKQHNKLTLSRNLEILSGNLNQAGNLQMLFIIEEVKKNKITQYNTLDVILFNQQSNKLKSGIKNGTTRTLYLS